jgi:hypothetical protein
MVCPEDDVARWRERVVAEPVMPESPVVDRFDEEHSPASNIADPFGFSAIYARQILEPRG